MSNRELSRDGLRLIATLRSSDMLLRDISLRDTLRSSAKLLRDISLWDTLRSSARLLRDVSLRDTIRHQKFCYEISRCEKRFRHQPCCHELSRCEIVCYEAHLTLTVSGRWLSVLELMWKLCQFALRSYSCNQPTQMYGTSSIKCISCF